MVCANCGAHNNPGRERCAVCGHSLVQLDQVLKRDRKTGHVLRIALIGLAVGGVVGVVLGMFVGAAIVHEGAIAGAVVGAWIGLWLGVPAGTVVGTIVGLFLPPPKEY